MSQVNKDTSVRVKESTKFRLDKSKGSKSHDAFIAEMLDYFDATGIMPQSKIASPAVTVKEQASRVIEVVRGVEKATNTRLKNIEQMLLRLVPGQMPVNENTSSSINPDEFMHLSQVQVLLEKAKEQDRLIANYRDEIDKLRTELDNASGRSDNHPEVNVHKLLEVVERIDSMKKIPTFNDTVYEIDRNSFDLWIKRFKDELKR